MWDRAQQYLATNNIVPNAAALVVFPGVRIGPDADAVVVCGQGWLIGP
jgi:hypothetical protein